MPEPCQLLILQQAEHVHGLRAALMPLSRASPAGVRVRGIPLHVEALPTWRQPGGFTPADFGGSRAACGKRQEPAAVQGAAHWQRAQRLAGRRLVSGIGCSILGLSGRS